MKVYLILLLLILVDNILNEKCHRKNYYVTYTDDNITPTHIPYICSFMQMKNTFIITTEEAYFNELLNLGFITMKEIPPTQMIDYNIKNKDITLIPHNENTLFEYTIHFYVIGRIITSLQNKIISLTITIPTSKESKDNFENRYYSLTRPVEPTETYDALWITIEFHGAVLEVEEIQGFDFLSEIGVAKEAKQIKNESVRITPSIVYGWLENYYDFKLIKYFWNFTIISQFCDIITKLDCPRLNTRCDRKYKAIAYIPNSEENQGTYQKEDKEAEKIDSSSLDRKIAKQLEGIPPEFFLNKSTDSYSKILTRRRHKFNLRSSGEANDSLSNSDLQSNLENADLQTIIENSDRFHRKGNNKNARRSRNKSAVDTFSRLRHLRFSSTGKPNDSPKENNSKDVHKSY
jgi:hypothetical protein